MNNFFSRKQPTNITIIVYIKKKIMCNAVAVA